MVQLLAWCLYVLKGRSSKLMCSKGQAGHCHGNKRGLHHWLHQTTLLGRSISNTQSVNKTEWTPIYWLHTTFTLWWAYSH
jgi:hypothetical protein